jgi:D-alanyl-D-alanine dipeptidase
MIAKKAAKAPPKLDHSTPLAREDTLALAGRYRFKDREIDIHERDGKAWILGPRIGMKLELRQRHKDEVAHELIADDLHAHGLKIARDGKKLVIGKDAFEPVADEKPKPAPEKLAPFIGEYGPDFNTLVFFEKSGQLWTQIEWAFVYPLKEIAENVFQFPDYGLYMGDRIKFLRDKSGAVTHVDAASMVFKRRPGLKSGETFKIDPVRPVDELRKIALASKPPLEKNAFVRLADLVDLATLDKTIKLDIRYASDNNFLGTPFYTSARAFLQRPAAEALLKAHKELAPQGYGLLIHDAYRPWYVTKMFHDATPSKWHHFVADPLQGSRHNRGCAVDLTLYDLKTGKAVEMPGGYDEMSDRSYPDYLGGTSLERWHRELLRRAMEKHGFRVYEAEWWHFDFHEWRQYPIMNVRFEDLKQ